MALDFPASPTHGQTFNNYIYDSTLPGWRNANSGEGVGLQFKAGLVPVVPTSLVVNAGTATTNLMGKVTFSGVTTLSLNGVFSSNYSNYRFFMEPTATTTVNNMNWRLRNNGTDYSTANYYGWGWYLDYNSGGYDTGQSVNAGTSGKFGYAYANNGTMLMGDIIDPYVTRPTAILNHQINGGTMWWRGGYYGNAVSADGLTMLFPNATSGTISIYGYRD